MSWATSSIGADQIKDKIKNRWKKIKNKKPSMTNELLPLPDQKQNSIHLLKAETIKYRAMLLSLSMLLQAVNRFWLSILRKKIKNS